MFKKIQPLFKISPKTAGKFTIFPDTGVTNCIFGCRGIFYNITITSGTNAVKNIKQTGGMKK